MDVFIAKFFANLQISFCKSGFLLKIFCNTLQSTLQKFLQKFANGTKLVFAKFAKILMFAIVFAIDFAKICIFAKTIFAICNKKL